MIDRRRHGTAPRGLDCLGIDKRALDDAKPSAKRLVAPWGAKVIDRLQHTKEHQPDAHTRGEQHREPPDIAVIGGGVDPADTNAAQK